MTIEQDAIDWLKVVVEHSDSSEAAEYANAILTMLSRPVLPDEPTEGIQEAILNGSQYWNCDPRFADRIYHALHAHLTAPKTKEVDVWRVEYAYSLVNGGWRPGICSYDTLQSANEAADRFKSTGPKESACITVTGPHKQKVPG